jgi:hypothetical protein
MQEDSIKQELDNTYLNLVSDNTNLTNIKAQEKIGKALFLVDFQETRINDLTKYKHGFVLLSIFCYTLLLITGYHLMGVYRDSLNKKIEFPAPQVTNINYRRVVVVRRSNISHSVGVKKSRFIAAKIENLNPKVNSFKLANLIISTSNTLKIDPFLVSAIIKSESNFNTTAISVADARGLMQLLHSTAIFISKRGRVSKRDLHEPTYNIQLGTAYIKYLISVFNGDTEKALMAYNWGPYNLSEAIKRKKGIHPAVRIYARNITSTAKQWSNEFNTLCGKS